MLLNLYAVAASRGDGLHPRLLALLRQREALAADPRIMQLDDAARDFIQAGPCPTPAVPDCLPRNVVRLEPPHPTPRRSAGT